MRPRIKCLSSEREMRFFLFVPVFNHFWIHMLSDIFGARADANVPMRNQRMNERTNELTITFFRIHNILFFSSVFFYFAAVADANFLAIERTETVDRPVQMVKSEAIVSIGIVWCVQIFVFYCKWIFHFWWNKHGNLVDGNKCQRRERV